MKKRKYPVLLYTAFAVGPILLMFSMALQAKETDDRHKHSTAMEMHGEHVHREMPDNSKGVRLEEQIGAMIPLDLEFYEESGQLVTLKQLIKGPVIIAPVYYSCSNVCNFVQTDLARVLPDIRLEPGKQFTVLSISIDDTENPLFARASKRMYFRSMRGKFPNDAWKFLTGNKENIYRLTDAAGYYFKKVGDSQIQHPVVIFVVNSHGQIVRYLHGTHFLPKDITLALVEAIEGRLGTTIQKMVRFCFSFDPKKKTYVFNLLRVTGFVVLSTLAVFLAFLVLGGKKKKLIATAEGNHGTTIKKMVEFCFNYIRVSGPVVLGTTIAFLLPGGIKNKLIEAVEERPGTPIQKIVRFCFNYDPEKKS
jgi:protein SCO1/2